MPRERDWQRLAELRLRRALKAAQAFPGLRKLGPRAAPQVRWSAEVRMLGAATMKKLNKKYRGKDYATDVLSFEAAGPFRAAGILGELVICLPVLKRQAKEQGHRPERELEILVVHGVLHLLGLDHERGPREARAMSRWEKKVLEAAFHAGHSGLIRRSSH